MTTRRHRRAGTPLVVAGARRGARAGPAQRLRLAAVDRWAAAAALRRVRPSIAAPVVLQRHGHLRRLHGARRHGRPLRAGRLDCDRTAPSSAGLPPSSYRETSRPTSTAAIRSARTPRSAAVRAARLRRRRVGVPAVPRLPSPCLALTLYGLLARRGALAAGAALPSRRRRAARARLRVRDAGEHQGDRHLWLVPLCVALLVLRSRHSARRTSGAARRRSCAARRRRAPPRSRRSGLAAAVWLGPDAAGRLLWLASVRLGERGRIAASAAAFAACCSCSLVPTLVDRRTTST